MALGKLSQSDELGARLDDLHLRESNFRKDRLLAAQFRHRRCSIRHILCLDSGGLAASLDLVRVHSQRAGLVDSEFSFALFLWGRIPSPELCLWNSGFDGCSVGQHSGGLGVLY